MLVCYIKATCLSSEQFFDKYKIYQMHNKTRHKDTNLDSFLMGFQLTFQI